MAAVHVFLAAAAIGLAQPVHEIEVTARKFAFEPATIQVVAGEPVRLVLTSADSVHGFAIRDLNIDVTIPKAGRSVTVAFTAPPAGRYEIACSEFCGVGHGHMKAALVSVAAPSRPPSGKDEERIGLMARQDNGMKTIPGSDAEPDLRRRALSVQPHRRTPLRQNHRGEHERSKW